MNNYKTQKETNDKIDEVRKEIYKIREEQNIHYHNILEKGKDTRQEGMVWAIRAIWYLGYDVRLTKLPRFLDKRSINYLFLSAKKEMELHEIARRLRDMRSRIREKQLRKINSLEDSKTTVNKN